MTNIVKKSCNKDKKTDCLINAQFLGISENLSKEDTLKAIRDLLTSSLLAFRDDNLVNHFQLPEQIRRKKTPGINGLKHVSALASYDHKLHSWKTSQISLLKNTSEPFLENWPKSGIMQDGQLYPLKMWEQGTGETGCGLWPTPTSSKNGPGKNFNNHRGIQQGNALATAVSWNDKGLYPTPTVCGNHNKKGLSKSSGDGLSTVVKNYPTPTSSMMTLGDMEQARFSGSDKKRPKYAEFVSNNNGQLNPDWVEWLIGWPIGWSNSGPLNELIWLNISEDPYPKISRLTVTKKYRTKRLKAIGNGQVPIQAAIAFTILFNRLKEK